MRLKISEIDFQVPLRTQGRTSSHSERYCLKIYLQQLSKSGVLKFPFSILKTEAPDFILSFSDSAILALEVTELGTEKYQKAMTELEKSALGTVLEAGTNRLVGRGGRLVGEGWDGDSVEQAWTSEVIGSIDKKLKKLNNENFQVADSYELLIYDNSHWACMLETERAVELLRNRVLSEYAVGCYKRMFRCVYIINSDRWLTIFLPITIERN